MIAKTEPNGVVTEFRYHKCFLPEVIQYTANWRYLYDDAGRRIEKRMMDKTGVETGSIFYGRAITSSHK